MPSQLTPNVWILTTAPSAAAAATISLICLGETTQFIEVRKPIHILHLPLACSAASPNFHLPKHHERPPLEVNISLDMANLNMINISSLTFHIWLHLEKYQNESQLQHLASIPSIPIGQLYSHMIKGIQHITPFSPEQSTADTDSTWTLFSHTRVCNSYRIAYTSRFGNILLLFLLVSTCQISTLTLTNVMMVLHQISSFNLYNQVPCNIQLWMMM